VVGRVVKERTFHLVPWLVWLSPPHARRVVKKRTSTPSTSDRQNNGFVYYAMPRCLGPSTHPDTNARCTAMTNTACKPRDSARSAPLSVCLSALPLISYLISISIYLYLSYF
jgi:hypothetical protein